MSMRLRELKRFVNTLEDEGIFDFNINEYGSRLRLQKYVFFNKYFDKNIKYQYGMYIHGPYSTTLAKNYYKIDKINDNTQMSISKAFLNFLNGKSERWLEIASTLMMVKKQYNKDEENELIEHVAHNKKSSPTFVTKVVEDLKNYKLLFN